VVKLSRLLFVLVLSAAGCGYTPDDEGGSGEGPGHREQPLALSPRQELQVGRRAYADVMEEYRGRVVPDHHPDMQRVDRIVARLRSAAEIEPLQREIHLRVQGYAFEWQTTVVQDRQVNAFCLPAGKIFVFTGILPVAESDDQLATVLAHEMAHALAHHGSERIAREQSGGGRLTRLKYDRFQESEADHIGVFLMTFAGYDPNQAVAFWQRMERLSGGREPPEFLSDHPGHETRVQQIREWVPKSRAAKQAYDQGRIAPAGR
jgi:metalloendopeptidase OMA1, mitochondrial